MSDYQINFINHSCIKVENEKHSVLFDVVDVRTWKQLLVWKDQLYKR